MSECEWVVYTPGVGGWTLGNGSIGGRYWRDGAMVITRGRMDIGSTTVIGGAGLQIVPPFAPVGNTRQVGSGEIVDGSGRIPLVMEVASAGNLIPLGMVSASPVRYAALTSATPTGHTWAAGQILYWEVTYQADPAGVGLPDPPVAEPVPRPGVVEDAVTEWWGAAGTYLTAPHPRTLVGAISSTGEVLACELNHGLGTVVRVPVAQANADDHDCPTLYAHPGRRTVVLWTLHGTSDCLYAKVSDRSGDIRSLPSAPVRSVDLGGGVSYCRVVRIPGACTATTDRLWVFARVTQEAWQVVPLTVGQDTGVITSGTPVAFVQSAGQCYLTIADAHEPTGQRLRVAWGYNPNSSLHAVRYVEIDAVTGAVTSSVDPTVTGNVLTGANLPLIDTAVVPLLPDPSAGHSRRLFYVRPGPASPAVAYADWDEAQPDSATYKVTDVTHATTHYGTAGPRIGYTAGANYLAGMAFPDPCWDDDVIVARRAGAVSTVELHTSTGDVHVLAASESTVLARPLPPEGGGPVTTLYTDFTDYGASYTDYAGAVRAV